MRCTALHSSSFTEDHRGNNVSICKQGGLVHSFYMCLDMSLIDRDCQGMDGGTQTSKRQKKAIKGLRWHWIPASSASLASPAPLCLANIGQRWPSIAKPHQITAAK